MGSIIIFGVILLFIQAAHAIEFKPNCTAICNQVDVVQEKQYLGCDNACRRKMCFEGCTSWRKAGRTSCQTICKNSYGFQNQENIGCTLGCVYATQSYIDLIKGIIQEPSAPQLDGSSITNTTIGFRWKDLGMPNIHYLLQYRQMHSTSEWNYYQPDNPLSVNKATVKGLKPFTKYQFRLALVVLPKQPPILSDVSAWISTLPSGPPQSSPRNLRAIPLDWVRIEIAWDPPLYPSGELVSYTLYISDLINKTDYRKDVKYHGKVLRFIATGLQPNTTYEIAITAVNHFGEGPNSTTRGTTYARNSGSVEGGFLLIASGNGLLQQGLDITEMPKVLLNTTSKLYINGLAIHVPLQLVYLSDESGAIYQVHLPSNLKRVLLPSKDLNGIPTELSVDWLFGYVYVVLFLPTSRPSEWQIWRFDLMGKNLFPVMKGIPYQPIDLQVDPYNGYLWWISNDLNYGLHRISIKEKYSGSLKQSSRVILRIPSIDSMTIDSPNFRIILATSINNTLLSVSLDGSAVTDIRPNTQQASFTQVQSLAHIENKFFWTNGKEIFSEELYGGTFYHNSYTFTNEKVIRKIRAAHSSLQSVPVPLNPPKKVQALFTKNTAEITWDKPDIPSLKGIGSWQKWKYEIYISQNGNLITKSNLNETYFLFDNLPENTTMQIKVRAFSPVGRGPWSDVFKGRTLSHYQTLPKILWATNTGVFITNLNGSKATAVLFRNEQIRYQDYKPSDILYWNDAFYIAMEENSTKVYTTKAKLEQSWEDFGGITSLALDEATTRIFGSHPKTNTIIWKTLDGKRRGSFRVTTPVTQISIDSYHGQLYWRNFFGVYKSTLTGRNISTLHQEDIFSGRQVYGLAVIPKKPEVWWILKDSGGCRLFSLDPQMPTIKPVQRKILSYSIKEGSLTYGNELLMWLADEENLIIMDILLQDAAVIRYPFKKVIFMKKISSPLLEPDMSLLPGTIDPGSIKVKGTWKDFNVTWNSLTDKSGSLRYEITVLAHRGKSTYVLKENNLKLGWSVNAFTPLTIKIRGVTNWAFGNITSSDIRTPSAKPGKPVNLRLFTIKNKNATAHLLRWSAPINTNGIITKFIAKQCYNMLQNKNKKCNHYLVNGSILYRQFNENINDQLNYEYSVTASTVVGQGTQSDTLQIEGSYLKQLPSVLLINDHSAKRFDPDLGQEQVTITNMSIVQADYDTKVEALVLVDENSDIYKIPVKDPTKIERVARMHGSGRSLTLDWIGKRTFWIEDTIMGVSKIKYLEWKSTELKTLTKLRSNTQSEYKLTASPKENLLYVNEIGRWSSSLVAFSMDEKYNFDVFDNSNRLRNDSCNCPKSPNIAGFAVDSSETDTVSLYVSLKQKTFEGNEKSQILKIENRGCSCSSVVILQNFGYGVCTSLAVDAFYLYCLDDNKKRLLWMPKNGPTRKEEIWTRQLEQVNSILAVDAASHPMPSLNCLMLLTNSLKPLSISSDTGNIRLRLPVVGNDKSKCGDVAMPPGNYLVFYDEVYGNGDTGCRNNVKICKSLASKSQNITIPNLNPFTNYTIRIAYETPYNIFYSIPIQPTQDFYVMTGALAPKGVRSLSVYAVSPSDIKVTFESPEEKHFQVHWRTKDRIAHFISSNLTPESKNVTTVILENLISGEVYKIWIRSFSEEDQNIFTDSEIVKSKTLPLPQKITLIEKLPTTIKISWKSPIKDIISRHQVLYKEQNEDIWNYMQEEITEPDSLYITELQALKPGSVYLLRLKLLYTIKEDHEFMWPEDKFFQYTTAGDVPSKPGKVRVHMDGWKVWWEESLSNGKPILAYDLQVAEHLPDAQFKTMYNGSDNFWKISPHFPKEKSFIFRVLAINIIGESDWSEESVIHSFDGPAELSINNIPIILAATIPSSLTFLGILFICLSFGPRRSEKRWKNAKPSSLRGMMQHSRNREIELATVPHLPINNNFVTENNILYNMQSLPGDDLELPHVPRSSITLTKFLGSGAFGEVFEGTASDLPGMSPVSKVAIKALRKGATENEKTEFLKEATLMSRFNHDHILRLLAVCTDSTPYFLILELMQGGDLLSYLRANRGAEKGLALQDLLQMCVDVAKGCVYLEDMHFVHRDIAARNCLVSSTDPKERLVKIGDFGLARDVYKNDYYRKEGEGLLPVRWMSPESLTDGVFTTQSDVWAFGVLLWEIMTLGQQPYPARTNLEVLHYVRVAGKPTKPSAAPEDLCVLMEQCWSYSPELRPTFKECLMVLISLKTSLGAMPSMAVHNANYMKSNRCLSVESNTADSAWTRSENEDNGASSASTLPLNTPLTRREPYLQLVNESFSPAEGDNFNIASLTNSNAVSPMTALINELSLYQISNLDHQCLPNSSTLTNISSTIAKKLDKESGKNIFTPNIHEVNNSIALSRSAIPTVKVEEERGRSFSLLSPCNSFRSSPDRHRLPSFCSPVRKYSLLSLPSSPMSSKQINHLKSPNSTSLAKTTFTFQLPSTTHKSKSPHDHYLRPISARSCSHSPPRNLLHDTYQCNGSSTPIQYNSGYMSMNRNSLMNIPNSISPIRLSSLAKRTLLSDLINTNTDMVQNTFNRRNSASSMSSLSAVEGLTSLSIESPYASEYSVC